MTADDVCALSAEAIVAAVRARQLTAERVMECHLARTERLEQVLNTDATLDVKARSAPRTASMSASALAKTQGLLPACL